VIIRTHELEELGLAPQLERPKIPGNGPQSIAELLDRPVRDTPSTEALVGRYARYTFAELDEAVNRAANALIDAGVAPGDRVAASLPNQTEIVVAFLGAMRLGAIWVGINTRLAPPEKAYMLRDADVSVLLADASVAEELHPLRSELSDLHEILVAEAGDPTCRWAQLMAGASADRPAVDIAPFGPAAIAYTSGTTGFPKGAVHSQHNLLLPGAVAASDSTYERSWRHGILLPLTLLNLMVLGPLRVYQLGATLVVMDRVDPVGVAEWVRQEQVASFSSAPAILHGLFTHPDVTEEDLRSLVRPGVGGADMPEAFRRFYRERFGRDVVSAYGLTEAPAAVTIEDAEGPRPEGGTGKALAHVSIYALDDDGNELPAGEVGEICVGPATEGPFAGVYTPMLGYWKRPDATAEALRGGLLHTGDLGMLDTDGNLFIKDREVDLVIRGGSNVYPAEVERVLHEDARLEACAVVGVPDERLGERVVAAIEVRSGQRVTADELRELCLRSLARYKVPEEFRFVESFDRTPMGKIRKAEVRELFVD
jgi:long-chain acyl-CoA synthetase